MRVVSYDLNLMKIVSVRHGMESAAPAEREVHAGILVVTAVVQAQSMTEFLTQELKASVRIVRNEVGIDAYNHRIIVVRTRNNII